MRRNSIFASRRLHRRPHSAAAVAAVFSLSRRRENNAQGARESRDFSPNHNASSFSPPTLRPVPYGRAADNTAVRGSYAALIRENGTSGDDRFVLLRFLYKVGTKLFPAHYDVSGSALVS